MMDCVSAETEARLRGRSRNYTRVKGQYGSCAERNWPTAIVAERREGTLIEDITERVPVRQTQVNRILEAAGLTQPRRQKDA